MGSLIYQGTAVTAAGGTITIDVDVESTGTWPARGRVYTLKIRHESGSATKYAWGLYSEDPDTATRPWESLIAGAFDYSGKSGEDDRQIPIGNTDIPDVFIVFDGDQGAWQTKTTDGRLYVKCTPDAGADNVFRVWITAGPRRVKPVGDELQ